MARNSLLIDLLGSSFRISADEDKAYLESLLDQYRQRIENARKKTGLENPLQLALVTGFLLCDEIQKGEFLGDETERLTLDLITRIDAALPGGEEPAPPPEGDGEAAPPSAATSLPESAPPPPAPPPPPPAERPPAAPLPRSGEHPPFLKLENTVKHYPWGSARWIPQLLNRANEDNRPWAELWMGTHPGGPSLVERDGGKIPLGDLVAEDPAHYLGAGTARDFGGLPFLFKLLAAGKPLSLQAHPNPEQAKEGWEAENRRGIPLDDPRRNYRDRNHKPELLCALGDFRALCGFRERRDIVRLFRIFCGDQADPALPGVRPPETVKTLFERLREALEGDDGLRDMMGALLGLDRETRRDLGAYATAQTPQLGEAWPGLAEEWRAVSRLAELHPEDPGIVAPLYLNLVRLKSGEAIYLPPGVLHGWLEGFGVELQASSDNVLRGGLTEKHVDGQELLSILRFTPWQPAILQGVEKPGAAAWYGYPVSCREFSLSITQSRGEIVRLPPGPSIVLVTQGQARLTEPGGGELILGPGESAFVAPGETYAAGFFTAFAAGPGDPR